MKKRKPGMIVRKAEKRLKGMLSIDKNYKSSIDYGGPTSPLTSTEVTTQIKLCLESNKEYNKALITADQLALKLKTAEAELADIYSRILSGCVSKFGNDAPEITLLGGTRKSDRKKTIKNNNKYMNLCL